MLNPNVRSLYTSALMPPAGMRFGEAITTTFSMDPSVLLQAPVYLSLLAGDGSAAPKDALCALEAIRRHSDKITAYVQRGRIAVPSHATTLYSLLESMTVEVTSPNGGVFHPKLWLIRFISPGTDHHVLRLVVLSRNLTADRSWDLSLQLDGRLTGRPRAGNRALSELIRRLPGWATGSVDERRVAQAVNMAEDVRKVDWELPAGFDEHAATFYIPGLDGSSWKPEPSLKLAVISPFCGNRALEQLVATSDEPVVLISNAETLTDLDPSMTRRFRQCMCLDQAAETDDGEDAPRQSTADALGLHAKAYLFERRYYKNYTHLVMGSANATDAALVAENNIELLVELVGRSEVVGGVDDLLGDEGMGEYLVPFVPGEATPLDAARQAAEQSMEAARELLCAAGLRLDCTPTESAGQHRLLLVGTMPPLKGIRSCRAWPITLTADHGVLLNPGESSTELASTVASASVTGLIAFELLTAHPEVNCRFVLSLPIQGVPHDRDAAVLQTIINNEEGFLRYLLLLLGEDESGSAGDPTKNGTFARWLAALGSGADVPLLEELTRTFCRTPERLHEVRRLIDDLRAGSPAQDVISDRFLALWHVFEQAMEVHDAR
jgi:hypothetical protein